MIAGIPEAFRNLIKKALTDVDLSFVDALRNDEALAVSESADMGVTWADFGVAQKGALMEVVYDDAAKLASSLPFTHVALLSSKNMLNDLPQALAQVEKILHSSSDDRMPVISFISGPSKTSDIELKLLYGVHGPNALHVLILKWI